MSEDIQYRVWVGCLESYNNGDLVGEWVDLKGHDEESFLEAIQEIIRGEEWGFFDYELPFHISVYESVETLFAKLEAYETLLEQCPEDLANVVVDNYGEDWFENVPEVCYYVGDSVRDLGWEIAESHGIDLENNPFASYMTYSQWEHWIERELAMTVVYAGYDTVYAYEIL